MVSISNKYNCCGCGACAAKCPKKCIRMESDSEGFVYPVVEEKLCLNCNLCEQVCPLIKKEMLEHSSNAQAFAMYSNDDNVLFESSSGGVFHLLSKYVLNNGGVVFGAAYTEDFSVKHICVGDLEQLKKLQGSKYVQSSTSDSYKKVLENLEKGTLVLYSGTMCQIEGLYSFLNKDYENLFTVDVVCTGVPSPLLWENYIKYRGKKAHSKITKVNLRYKKYGWQEYIVFFESQNGKTYESVRFADPYMRAFREHYSIRPSCYQCKFKTLYRNSDVTVADFWGIEKLAPDMNNRKGTSLAIVQSSKGEKLLSEVKKYTTFQQVDVQEAANCNPMMIESASEPSDRKEFFVLASKSLLKASNKFCKISIKQKLSYMYINIKRKLCG